MPRYKIQIEYLGTQYNGWQKQPNAPTVEEEIEDTLDQVLGRPIDVIGQGRTDSGVHAEGQVAHFDTTESIDTGKLHHAFLGVLPPDIAVWDIKEVDPQFHARFDATYRRYRYLIARRPKPLIKKTSILVLQDLDEDAMKKCADLVTGEHNFDSFTKPDNQNPSSDCKVSFSAFTQTDSTLTYSIQANRFVRHLVRRLIGTMLEVGKGKKTVEEFKNLLLKPSKKKNAHGAPAKGLILEKVGYKKD